MKFKICTIFILLFILVGSATCTPASMDSNARRTQVAATIYAEQTQQSRASTTNMPAATRLPTSTPIPSPTPTITPVPAGYPPPQPKEPITASNAARVIGLAQWGTGAVHQTVASSGGEVLAIATSLGIDIYDGYSLELRYHLTTERPVTGIAVSQPADLVVYAQGDRIILAKLSTGQQFEQITFWTESLDLRVALSPDGAYLAVWAGPGGWDTNITIFETKTLSEVYRVSLETSIGDVKFSPSSTYLVASGNGVYLWRLSDGTLVNKISDWYVTDLDGIFSTDDQLFVEHAGLDINVMDLSSGLPKATLENPAGYVHNHAFSPDGKFLALGGSEYAGSTEMGMILLWQIEKNKVQKINPKNDVISLAFSVDGQYLASASSEATIELRQLNENRLIKSFKHEGVEKVFFLGGGKTLISLSKDHSAKAWSVPDASLQKTFGDPALINKLADVAISPDSNYIATISDIGSIAVWHVADGQLLYSLQPSEGYATEFQVGFTHDSKFLVSVDTNFVRQWSLQTGDQTRWLTLTEAPDYSGLLSITRTAKLIDTTEDLVLVFVESKAETTGYCSRRSDYITTNKKSAVLRLRWASDFATFKSLACVVESAANVLLSPDRTTLFTHGDVGENLCYVETRSCKPGYTESPTPPSMESTKEGLFTWNVKDGSLYGQQETGYFSEWTSSPDGKFLAMVTTGGMNLSSGVPDIRIDIFDVLSGSFIQSIPISANAPPYAPYGVFNIAMAFSPDSSILAAGLDRNIILWQINSGQIVQTLTGHVGAVTGLDFSNDGTLLVSSSEDGTVRLWGIP